VTTRAFAWLVHLYTAMGLVCAAGMAVLIVRGDDAGFRGAFLLMMVATAIDATDGWLARKARVKEVLPGFDGSALDNQIDFLTYTALPLMLIWRAGLLPGDLAWLLLLPLLASAYGFSPVNVKTADGFFIGFPSYWNIVAYYLFTLQAPVWASVAVITICSVLTFVPTPYLYTTRGAPFSTPLNIGSAFWFVSLGVVLFGPGDYRQTIAIASLAFPLLYLGLSAFVTFTRTR
jgi:phosphatidylcholine synthase